MKNPWVIVLLVAIILIGGSVWYSKGVTKENNVGITFSPHVKGNADAVVTLTEYSDLQCPACASFQPILAEVMNEFGDDLKLEYKHFPLPIHPFAEPAARAAEAAGQQDAFFAFHDKLFQEQAIWSRTANPTVSFVKYAEELGLDVDMFKRHMNASLIRDKVRAEGKEAREKGLTGTPSFFLNGERMSFESFEDFKKQIALKLNPQVNFTVSDEAGTGEVEGPAVQFGI